MQGDLPDWVVPIRDVYARLVEHTPSLLEGRIALPSLATTLFRGCLLFSSIAAQPGAMVWLQRVDLATGRLVTDWGEAGYVEAVIQVRGKCPLGTGVGKICLKCACCDFISCVEVLGC
jgi:hypothetical protein